MISRSFLTEAACNYRKGLDFEISDSESDDDDASTVDSDASVSAQPQRNPLFLAPFSLLFLLLFLLLFRNRL